MGIDLGRFRSNKNNDEWLDWLADDPVPASLRQRMRDQSVERASRPVVRRPGEPPRAPQLQPRVTPVQPSQQIPKVSDNPAVSIHISLPKFKKPKLTNKLPKLPKKMTYRKLGVGSGVLLLVVVIGVVALNVRSGKGNKTGNTGVLGTASEKATFDTLTANKSTQATEKRYDAEKKVVSYTDSIGGVTITISQQQLPGGFQDNPDEKVKKLAQDFSANEVLSTANPTAYLGTSVKGPQTVIFTKKGLLIFIQSTKKIDNHDWAEYITNMN